MLASVFSPPAVRSKRTPATPTLVTGVTPGAYGRRDHSHQYYAYGRRVSNQRERQELADQAALAPIVAVLLSWSTLNTRISGIATSDSSVIGYLWFHFKSHQISSKNHQFMKK